MPKKRKYTKQLGVKFLGAIMIQIRTLRKISVEFLANEMGLSSASLSKIENDQTNYCRKSTTDKIDKVFNWDEGTTQDIIYCNIRTTTALTNILVMRASTSKRPKQNVAAKKVKKKTKKRLGVQRPSEREYTKLHPTRTHDVTLSPIEAFENKYKNLLTDQIFRDVRNLVAEIQNSGDKTITIRGNFEIVEE